MSGATQVRFRQWLTSFVNAPFRCCIAKALKTIAAEVEKIGYKKRMQREFEGTESREYAVRLSL
jgi:hypothetical protein